MIYICIPALNEAPTVGVLLWRIRQVMAEFPRDYHLLVLDDGSTDATAEVLAPYPRVLPLTVLRNERTAGYGPALERLVREAVRLSTHPKRDVVVTLQADFTEPPEEIPSLVRKIEGGADVVGSTIVATDGELPRSVRWTRKGLGWLLPRARLPREVEDPFSGFRAYRVQVLRRALQERDGKPFLSRGGWAANAELLLAVLPHTRRAEGAPVQLRYAARERETRFRPWGTVREVWDLVRATPRRLPEGADGAAPAQPGAQPGQKPAGPQGPKPPSGPSGQKPPAPPAGPPPAGPEGSPGGGEGGERQPGRGPRRGGRRRPPGGGRNRTRSTGGA